MNPPSKDIASIIQSAGIATLGTDMFVSNLPDDPDDCVALIDTGSWGEPESDLGYSYPLLQVVVRGAQNEYLSTYSKAVSIRDTIMGLSPQTINSIWYSGFWVSMDVSSLGRDERDRIKFAINFRIMRGG